MNIVTNRCFNQYELLDSINHLTQITMQEIKTRKEKSNYSSVMQLRLTARQRSHLMIQASRKSTTVPTILRTLILKSIKDNE